MFLSWESTWARGAGEEENDKIWKLLQYKDSIQYRLCDDYELLYEL
jgi:hypothetical protein